MVSAERPVDDSARTSRPELVRPEPVRGRRRLQDREEVLLQRVPDEYRCGHGDRDDEREHDGAGHARRSDRAARAARGLEPGVLEQDRGGHERTSVR